MSNLQSKSNLSKEKIESLKTDLRGEVVVPTDGNYEEVRKIWNDMVEKRPAVIARCRGMADVMRSVAFGREHNLLVSVRGGGHNIAGNSLCEGGLMIDLSLMKSVRIDPENGRAYVEPGATLGDFDHEAQAFGLATPVGINSTTGVAGLTLGGGFGWLSRKYGLTVDNLISAEMVLADGKRVVANAKTNPDLFWAIRGGGGNFGIVTLFEFQLHPVGPEVLSGLMVFPFSQAKTVLTKYRDYASKLPSEDVNVWTVMRKAPPLPFLSEKVHGELILALAVFCGGDREEGNKVVETLRTFGTPVGEHIGPTPYKNWQQAFDPLLTPGARNYWKSHNFTELKDGLFDTLMEYAKKLPSPQCEMFIGLVDGQTSRVPKEATAYAHRDAKFVLNVHGRWEKAEDDKKCIGWARDFFKASNPYAMGGVYVNFMTEEETDRIGEAYGPNYKRLVELKKKYDPDNFFRLNQNIKP